MLQCPVSDSTKQQKTLDSEAGALWHTRYHPFSSFDEIRNRAVQQHHVTSVAEAKKVFLQHGKRNSHSFQSKTIRCWAGSDASVIRSHSCLVESAPGKAMESLQHSPGTSGQGAEAVEGLGEKQRERATPSPCHSSF